MTETKTLAQAGKRNGLVGKCRGVVTGYCAVVDPGEDVQRVVRRRRDICDGAIAATLRIADPPVGAIGRQCNCISVNPHGKTLY